MLLYIKRQALLGVSRIIPVLNKKAMDPNEQLPDHSAGIMSPQSSVDASSRDRAVVTEGKPLDIEWGCVICSVMGLEFLACIVYLTHMHTYSCPRDCTITCTCYLTNLRAVIFSSG